MDKALQRAIVQELREWANTAEPSLQNAKDDAVTLHAPFFELGLNLIRNVATLLENDS